MNRQLSTIEDYMALPYTEWVRPDEEEGGFIAGVEELPGCYADGETRAEALEELQDAKRSWLQSALQFGDRIPPPLDLEDYSGKMLVRASKSLHRDLAHRAALEGVSLNQLCVSLLSRSLGIPIPSQTQAQDTSQPSTQAPRLLLLVIPGSTTEAQQTTVAAWLRPDRAMELAEVLQQPIGEPSTNWSEKLRRIVAASQIEPFATQPSLPFGMDDSDEGEGAKLSGARQRGT